MIRVVLDANQFASALIKPGSNPALILDCLRGNLFQLVISESIVAEIKRILLYPKLKNIHGLEKEEIDVLFDNLTAFALFTPEQLNLRVVAEDASDDKYVNCALEGNAAYLITGDHHLLNLEMAGNTKIITPKDFLNLLSVLL
jgi:putative PIN family toxin of toxin-antitoxin system